MNWLSDDALRRLRSAAGSPDLSGTRYRLLEFVARGGMGVVYLAEDSVLRRRVALKILDPVASSPGLAARLLREARILARLEHPGIVPVHDVGTLADGRVFYAMKFVEGRRLDHHLQQIHSVPERLRLYGKICEAVAFAHARGILHRDLKPENVMVGPFGEVLVMDWGLAKSLHPFSEDAATLLDDASLPSASHSATIPHNDASSAAPRGPSTSASVSRSSEISSFPPALQRADSSVHTAHGSILGTPGYMSPEQARGDVTCLDQRSDVFALGALLFYLLTGRPPSSGAGAGTPAPAPSPVPHDSLPRPLAAICRKSMAADPASRYPSASELAAEVARYLDGEPVSAYPEGLLGKAGRFISRHQIAFLLVLTFLVVRVLLLLVFRR